MQHLRQEALYCTKNVFPMLEAHNLFGQDTK